MLWTSAAYKNVFQRTPTNARCAVKKMQILRLNSSSVRIPAAHRPKRLPCREIVTLTHILLRTCNALWQSTLRSSVICRTSSRRNRTQRPK
ncbi:uncharacterized protein EI90DRAFT_3036217 [Cantharellus anzutake]|uniref:uncharacterized protein n=1 Tax=Cantharellus anzutake TaxID=1750568 RepID=UPI00190642EE|nr:uncharacterized protein EI90DRAFT_3036217 [Cantharellus anzutake]KAF8340623.1 hypothetical protein EI90DRAFT_3036217 [Cantharellus anzutake]